MAYLVKTQKIKRTEPNPKYWPPPLNDHSLEQYVRNYRQQGIYPPLLTAEEKRTIDMVGQYDSKGNQYGVTWTLGGHPITNKKDQLGFVYDYDSQIGRYKRHEGCFGVKYLD